MDFIINSHQLTFSDYAYQVAGHERIRELTLNRTILPTETRKSAHQDTLYAVVKPTTKQEADFYTQMLRHDFSKHWMATFYGLLPRTLFKDDEESFVVIEDLIRANSIKSPAILDVKIGKRQYGDNVKREKKEKMIRLVEETSSKEFGFRITGLRVPDQQQGIKLMDKKQCKEYKSFDGLADVFKMFLLLNQNSNAARLFLEQVKRLRSDFEKISQHVRLYSCSILLVYDTADESKVIVRIIDFAHSYVHEEAIDSDDGVAFGLDHLERLLLRIVQTLANKH